MKGSVRQFLGTRPLLARVPRVGRAGDGRALVPARDPRLRGREHARRHSAALYQRDPELFRDLLRRTIEIHERLYREWPRLSQLYREQLGEVTSPQRWEKTFAASMEES